uniref:Uncharacterized protein n=1 Tax=viral metagenome TaxID=1070528 RepID=A0A6C0JQL6_9ZZZZ
MSKKKVKNEDYGLPRTYIELDYYFECLDRKCQNFKPKHKNERPVYNPLTRRVNSSDNIKKKKYRTEELYHNHKKYYVTDCITIGSDKESLFDTPTFKNFHKLLKERDYTTPKRFEHSIDELCKLFENNKIRLKPYSENIYRTIDEYVSIFNPNRESVLNYTNMKKVFTELEKEKVVYEKQFIEDRKYMFDYEKLHF